MPRRIIACTKPVVHCIDQCKDKHQLVDAEAEAAWGSGGRWQVVRLRQWAARRRGRRTVSGVYSINGGLDVLGLRAASLLATRGAIPLSLIATRHAPTFPFLEGRQGLLAQLHELVAGAKLIACHSADLLDMAALQAAHPQVSACSRARQPRAPDRAGSVPRALDACAQGDRSVVCALRVRDHAT